MRFSKEYYAIQVKFPYPRDVAFVNNVGRPAQKQLKAAGVQLEFKVKAAAEKALPGVQKLVPDCPLAVCTLSNLTL